MSILRSTDRDQAYDETITDQDGTVNGNKTEDTPAMTYRAATTERKKQSEFVDIDISPSQIRYVDEVPEGAILIDEKYIVKTELENIPFENDIMDFT